MKAIFITLALVGSLFSYEIKVEKVTDEMTDEVSIKVSKELEFGDESRGFIVFPWVAKDFKLKGLSVYSSKIGNCMKKDDLIILLENGAKVKLTSWNDFNCRGDSYYDLNEEQIYLLKSHPMKKVMFRNGVTMDRMVSGVKPQDSKYMMRLISKLKEASK